ncbi:LLM class flavin-dependent oxidoreductase [Halomonas halocynthiae]|uniref:LLM class flavin-dependent oxidoreductase n=1 Tax=Halomonas halocynthiae TaxID=176290 RepID=UPI0004272B75|nr:LLM class flavin-dependent oxidoreductase [Halomonas halocynthiae]
MEFSLFLPTYMPNAQENGDRVFNNMLEKAKLAEEVGFKSVALPEHHFINILINPAPLITAVKIASITKNIKINTSVMVLPLADMRRLAGEIAVADILTEGRIQVGVGRGAFGYEFERFGADFSNSREVFDESLNVLLELLLNDDEVSWEGDYYNFEKIRIMPRPIQKPMPPIWIAALSPVAIYHCAKRGFNVQTSPLQESLESLKEQVSSFREGAKENGQEQKISVLRGGFITENPEESRVIKELAYEYYKRFSNIFQGPGKVEMGEVLALPMEQTFEELSKNLIIGTKGEVIDSLSQYAESGIDEVNLNLDMGASHVEVMKSIERFGKEVIPKFEE